MTLKISLAIVFAISLSASGEFKKTADLDYVGAGNKRQTLDLYLPEVPSEKPLPVLFWVHGGAWVMGNKDLPDFVLRVANNGPCAIVAINYRLTDEATWPAQLHDCKAALRWVRANSEKHRLDPDKIVVWGASAGGHLVSMLGTTQDDKKLDGDLGPHSEASTRVAAIVNFFGPVDLVLQDAHGTTKSKIDGSSPEAKLVGGKIAEHLEVAKEASPLRHVSKDDAPFLTVHGTKDLVVPYEHGKVFDASLDKAGVPSILLTVDGAGHGDGFGASVEVAMKDFLENHFFGKSNTLSDKTVAADR